MLPFFPSKQGLISGSFKFLNLMMHIYEEESITLPSKKELVGI